MNVTALEKRVWERLEQDPAAPITPEPEVLHALNQAQRTLVLLTLCLEKTSTLTLQPTTPFYGIRSYIADYLVPLRVTVGGLRVRPSSIRDFDARNANWQTATGSDPRYATLGINLFAVSASPAIAAIASITHAYVPALLVNGADVPPTPEDYHESLIKFATVWIRLKEGAQEFAKTVGLYREFLEDAAKLGGYVRLRSLAAKYDQLPLELTKQDLSRLVKGLVPVAPAKERGTRGEPAAG